MHLNSSTIHSFCVRPGTANILAAALKHLQVRLVSHSNGPTRTTCFRYVCRGTTRLANFVFHRIDHSGNEPTESWRFVTAFPALDGPFAQLYDYKYTRSALASPSSVHHNPSLSPLISLKSRFSGFHSHCRYAVHKLPPPTPPRSLCRVSYRPQL